MGNDPPGVRIESKEARGLDPALRVYMEPHEWQAEVKATTAMWYSSAKAKSRCMVSCGWTAEW